LPKPYIFTIFQIQKSESMTWGVKRPE